MFDTFLVDAPRAATAHRDLIASELANKAAYAAPRHRQAAPTAHSAAADELRAAADALRLGVLASDPSCVRAVIALLAGVGLNTVGQVTVGGAPNRDSASIHIDAGTALMWTDYRRIALEDAAHPDPSDNLLPAIQWVPKPIPTWLNKEVAEGQARRGELRSIDALFSIPSAARGAAVAPGVHIGRMRPTLVRLQKGMSQLALSLGHAELTTAFALNDPTLVPRARLFYVALPAEEIARACHDLYSGLGWADRVPAAVPVYVGSQAVATDAAIQTAWSHLRSWTEAALPARRYRLEQVIEHHNRYVRAVAWLFTFLIGARHSETLPLTARSYQAGLMYVIYPDKRTGPFGTPRPAVVCTTASRQLDLYASHLSALAARARVVGTGDRWVKHLDAVLARKDVGLLFAIEGDAARPIGSADFMSALPSGLDLAPNLGRHFWQTALHAAGLSSQVIDIFARHASRGTESLTTTSMLPLVTAHEQINQVQERRLSQMGITPLAGQGRRTRL